MITKSKKIEDIKRVSHNENTPTDGGDGGNGNSGKWADVVTNSIDSIADMAGKIWGQPPVYNTTNNDNTDSNVTYIALGVGVVLLVVILLVVLKK